MINTAFISLGANLKYNHKISLKKNIESAIYLLPKYDIFVKKVSNWYESEPVPVSAQPWYLNAVVKIQTKKTPEKLIVILHEIENIFGRKRSLLNEPRTLDLDILDYEGLIKKERPILPHPRMHLRHFVLLPMQDIDPNWIHPIFKKSINDLIINYAPTQKIRKL